MPAPSIDLSKLRFSGMATDPPVSEKQRRAMWAAAEGRSTLGIPKSVGEEFVGKAKDSFGRRDLDDPDDVGAKFLALKAWWDKRKGAKDMSPEEWDDLRSGLNKFLSEEQQEEEHAEDVIGDPNSGFYAMAQDRSIGPFLSEEMAKRALDLQHGVVPVGIAYDRSTARAYDANGRLKLATSHISKACINPYLGKEIPGHAELGLDPEKVYQLLRDPAELAKAAPTFNGLPILMEHVPLSADDHMNHADKVVGTTGSHATFNSPYLDNSLSIWSQEAIDGIEDDSQRELSSAYRYRPDMTPGTWNGQRYDGVMRDIVGNHVALVKKGRAGSDVVVGDSKENDMPQAVLSRHAARVQGALTAYFMPLLAQDAELDLTPILKDVTERSFRDKKKRHAIVKAAYDAAVPMMTPEAQQNMPQTLPEQPSKDGPGSVIHRLLDKLDGQGGGAPGAPAAAPGGGAPDAVPPAMAPNAGAPAAAAPPAGAPAPAEGGGDPIAEWCQSKGLSPEDCAELKALIAGEGGNGGEGAGAGEGGEGGEGGEDGADCLAGDETGKEDDMPKPLDQAAMDAAIKNERANQQAIRSAERAVRPYIGDVPAMDSADAVYKLALDAFGVKTEGVHPSAFPAMLAMVPRPDARPRTLLPAMDAAQANSYDEMFPTAGRIQTH